MTDRPADSADRSLRFPPGMGWRLAAGYAGLFLPFAVATPYLQRLLADRGFRESAAGLIQGTIEVLAALSPPIWGYLSDRTRRPRLVLFLGAAMSVPAFLAFGTVSTLAGAMAAAVVFGLVFKPLIPLTDGLAMHYIAARGGNYGQVRAGGSVAFILTLASLEWISALRGQPGPGQQTILIAFAVGAAVHLASILLLPGGRAVLTVTERVARPRPDLRLFLTRAFVLFTVSALLGRLAMAGYYQFFTTYLRKELGFANAGLLWAIGPISEIPVIYFSWRIMGRIGIRNLFALGLLGVVVRLVGLAFVTDAWQIVPLQLLHALTFGAYHAASVTYVSRLVPAHMKSTAQTLFAAVTMGIGGLVGGIVGGVAVETMGYSPMYLMMAGIAGAGLLVVLLLVPTLGSLPSGGSGAARNA